MRGDIRDTGNIHLGKLFSGINTPLTKINGNFIILESRTTSAGISVGSAENNTPREEKPKDIKKIMAKANKILLGHIPNITPNIIGIIPKIIPKIVDAIISPNNIIVIVTGLESSISRVLCLVSHGAIIGVMEEEVKNKVIVSKEANPSLISKPLPA